MYHLFFSKRQSRDKEVVIKANSEFKEFTINFKPGLAEAGLQDKGGSTGPGDWAADSV